MIERSALTVIDGDARIADAHVQQVLGYARIADLHALIRQHADELSSYGEVFRRSAKKPGAGSKGGRPTLTYYLNEAQATLICMFSRTERAVAARKLIIEVFSAWRTGQLASVAAPQIDPFELMAGRAGTVSGHLQAIAAMNALARHATHLPVWRNGRRPPWWSNYELRAFLTESHRQMQLGHCVNEAKKRFGVSVSISGLQRYWAKLDDAVGPGRAA